MVTLKEDTRKSIAELTLMDDIFMNKVFDNDIGRTALLLRIILKNDKIKVIKATTQQKLKNLLGHDLQLGILAQNENGTLFNVEIQNQSSGAAARRARYHLSLLDSLSLPKGKTYKQLPDNYVVFITQNDVLKGGLPLYHINRKIEENDKAFADGSHIIYVNNKIKDETPLGRLMHDFHCTKSEDMYSKVLADEVKYLKETEGGRGRMCRILEEMCEEVEKETAERVAKETARSLLALGKFSYEDISQGTGLPLEVVEELAAQKTA